MFETVYLTSAEKREFLNEFTGQLMIATKEDKQLIIKKEARKGIETAVEMLEKIKPITRQFPALGGMIVPAAIEEEAAEEPEIPNKAVETGRFLTSDDKVDNLLNDPRIKSIECSEGGISISRGKGSEKTGFRLNEQEAKSIIKKFSEKTKIPLGKGVFRAKVGNIAINAMISDVIDSRFLITKD